PAIQYIVEEAVAAGIEDILIITNRGKGAIEDHFDHSFELEAGLKGNPSKEKLYEDVKAVANLANIYFIRQKETKGLAHALLCGKSFVGNEPFAVLYGDDVIISQTPVCKQLVSVYEKYGKPVVGVKPVPMEQVRKYCSLKVTDTADKDVYFCDDMIEKPAPWQEFSNLSILGRVLLTPDVFDIIDALPPGAGGEIQLTDAMAKIARDSGVYALEFEGERFDMGAKLGFLTANLKVGLTHPETAEGLRAYIKELAKTL
ncbi:MAG: UTP--glucose-1-phosphate uridylyltransferase, partial [Clostridia bacterium]|nr:UTP--glucose-1-phosphate uridylyltransferase [Clostridia bacterium]